MTVLERNRHAVATFDRGAQTSKPLWLVTGPDPRTASRTAPVTVADLMTVAHVSDPDAPLLEIVYRILALGQREIVVVSGARPEGVITPSRLAKLADPAGDGRLSRCARDLLPDRTPRLLPDQDVVQAASIMSVDDAEALPVVDYRGTLVGVLARRHIIDHLAQVGSGLQRPNSRSRYGHAVPQPGACSSEARVRGQAT